MSALIFPLLFLGVFAFALFKKVRLFDAFSGGVKGALPLLASLFPSLAAVLILSELFSQSGLSELLARLLSPALNFFGIPEELAPLLLVKPFSGSGSMAFLHEIILKYGADSYLARCACVVYGSSETCFYLSALYFAGAKKVSPLPVLTALVGNFLAAVLGCLFCRIL